MTFNGDPCVKAGLIEALQQHERKDRFLHMRYLSTEGRPKGCALGCTLLPLNPTMADRDRLHHEVYALGVREHDYAHLVGRKYGIPAWLARLEESVFEQLPEPFDTRWPRELMTAIPVGVPYRELVVRVRDELRQRIANTPEREYALQSREYVGPTALARGLTWPSKNFAPWMRENILELLSGARLGLPEPVCSLVPEKAAAALERSAA